MSDDPLWPRASTWLRSDGPARLGVVGVPLSRSSISPSRADSTPTAVREALHRFPTWHAGLGVELPDAVDHGDLDVADLAGDEAVTEVRRQLSELPSYELLVLLGGDNLVTWPGAQAVCPDLSGLGVLTLDAHHDVRGWHDGPTNGTPVRGLLEAGLPGTQVVQVGIGDLSNSRDYADFCRAEGITTIGLAECRGRVGEVVTRELDRLARTCDVVYVDLDVDVVDRSFVPGCPGVRPGGLLPHELLEAAVAAGRHPAVRAVDVTEVDASTDVNGVTVQLAAMCLLSAAAGLATR